jgi:beta-galactosidase
LVNFDDENWMKIDLPYNWGIEGKSEKNNPSGGDDGFYTMGTAW